ncbi:MAG: glycosyltransferase family 4 protein [Phycisphaerae bacterium]
MNPTIRHILFVENGTGIGGATRCLQGLVRTCRSSGWRVSVAMSYPLAGLEGPDDDVTVLPLYADAAFQRGQRIRRAQINPGGRAESIARFWSAACLADWPVARRLARYVRRHRVNLIHANNDLLVNRVALLAGRLAGVPVISHQRGWAQPSRINNLLERWCARMVAVSDSVQQNLVESGISSDKVCRIYDGVDVSQYTGAQDRREAARAELGFKPEDQVIGLPAVLLPWKGHGLFLDAFARIAEHRPGVKALFVGASPTHAADLLPRLKQQAAALGLAKRVTWAGHVEDMPSAYAAMDVVVHASVAPEPFGLVVLEAMASGRPVLAVDEAGPAEMVRHGVNGWLYPMGDVNALAEGLSALLDDPALRERLARAGRKRAVDFDPTATADAVTTLYDQVLGMASDKPDASKWPAPSDRRMQTVAAR